MKVHIIFNIKNQPTGGGNQFLKALKNYFANKNVYAENPREADLFLFNSYQFIPQVIKLKKKYPKKLFVHRIDGPIRLYSQMNDMRDEIINTTNKFIADATIFQSEWSKKENHNLGLEKNSFETVITNAPDKNIFNDTGKIKFDNSRKTKLIATSWSSQLKKGFKIYKWLDDNLDFFKYEMIFCGNSPVKFKNIKYIKPLPSNELAKKLKTGDIFITASQKDPCSNSVIEALHCGLPVIALRDGGHPEIIGKAGELFDKKEEIPDLITKIINNYDFYIQNIKNPEINEVAEKYLSFFSELIEKKNITSKKITYFKTFAIKMLLMKLKIKSEIKNRF